MKKKIIFILLAFFVVLLISIVGIKSFSTEKVNIPITHEKEKSKTDNKEKLDTTNNESNQEELTNSKEEIVEKENEIDNNTSEKNNTRSYSNSTTPNTNSNNEHKTTVDTPQQSQTIQEETQVSPKQQTTPTNSYVGVPNPNDFYYSFHKGHIDKNYTTLDGCNSRTAEVYLIAPKDVINMTCFEVLDGQGTVLGIYMYVKCHSGNCERYKTLVGIETN